MVFNLLQCVLLLKLLLTARAALGPHSDLRIVNADVKPDGFTRPAVLADGSFPGPLIRGNKGDNFQINVIDKLTNEDMLKSTSIHWHGLFQRGTNWADGPAFVTQCPITTGHAFMYNFDVPDQAGTFWYHSHLSTQYCDGLRGPLVVYDANDPHRHMYDVDTEDTVITLADWYHTLARKEPSGPVTPDSTLINGLGRYSNQTEPSELSVITVQWNKRYRMRLINMACEPNYQFSIDNHNMTVIEADGVNTQPLNVTSLTIFAGQRYSFILHANQLNGTYWIRAKPSTGADPSFNGGLNSAILRYNNVPLLEPTTTIGSDPKPLNETNLHPLVPTRVPGRPHRGGADFVRDLKFTFNNGSFFVNNVTFVPPTVPVLLQILSGARNAQDLLPKGSLIELPRHSSVELSMPGGVVGGGHPLHLHGHNFHVVRSAGSDTYNYENPVIRDTVNIGGKVGTETDNVTIRFETDNAGPWFLHCHIDWHLDAGFAVVMVEDIPHIKPDNIVSSDWDQLCPLYDSLSLGEQ